MKAAPTMVVLVAALIVGCRAAPNTKGPDVPDGVRVSVEVEGRTLAPITTDQLRRVQPTYLDEDHRAWRLDAVLPADAVREGLRVDVEDASGQRVIFARIGESTQEPVLMVNRKGQVLVALVEPSDPFPAFHGRGGNRGAGSRANRIRDVVKLRLTSE